MREQRCKRRGIGKPVLRYALLQVLPDSAALYRVATGKMRTCAVKVDDTFASRRVCSALVPPGGIM
jgi:hypothetical protein